MTPLLRSVTRSLLYTPTVIEECGSIIVVDCDLVIVECDSIHVEGDSVIEKCDFVIEECDSILVECDSVSLTRSLLYTTTVTCQLLLPPLL